MPVHNTDVARVFNKIADLLDIKGENQFRVRAYREGARTVGNLSRDVADMVEAGEDLTKLSGIGDDLAAKIGVIVESGTHPLLEELEKEIPPGLVELLQLNSLGPKRVQKLYEELGVTGPDDLEKAVRSDRITELEGFGDKLSESISESLDRRRQTEDRFLLERTERVVESLLTYLSQHEAVRRAEVAGSYRRRRETVGDLDVLVVASDGKAPIEHFTDYEDVDEIIAEGDTKSSVLFKSGIQVDVRVVEAGSYGAALHYFTGSKEHNIQLRSLARDRGLKVNEYGVFDGDEQVAGETEESIYELFECDFIVPELREARGEIEAARNGSLPDLVELDDLRGDFQCHTVASDGADSLREMGEAARELGHEYLAITDHSRNLGVAGGLEFDELRRQLDRIDELNEQWDEFRLLKSHEVDILESGELDLDDDLLAELDVAACAIHSAFNLSEQKQTERVLEAMKNPYFDLLVHPTGRKMPDRGPYPIDLNKVVDAAREYNCYLEINAQPERLDLDDVNARAAAEAGVRLGISTDAHTRSNLNYLKYGVCQARRGWLEPDDVLNTMSWNELAENLTRNQ